MNVFHFAWHHIWWIVGLIVLLTIPAFVFKAKMKQLLRICKALARDPRLPRPVRWLFGLALAIKVLPIPDFGIDEVALILGAILLFGPYRHVWRAIKEETRQAG